MKIVAYGLIDTSRSMGSDQGLWHGLDVAYPSLSMCEFSGIL